MTTDTISNPYEIAPTVAQPVTGSPLGDTLRRCAETGRSVFLFGGDATSIRALRERALAEEPRLRIAGICDADFTGPAGDAILDHIATCAPDVVVVDLSSKRHRALIAEVAARGLRFTLLNRPGSFGPYAAAGAGLRRSAMPGPLAGKMRGWAAPFRFAGIILRQLAHSSGPRLSTRD